MDEIPAVRLDDIAMSARLTTAISAKDVQAFVTVLQEIEVRCNAMQVAIAVSTRLAQVARELHGPGAQPWLDRYAFSALDLVQQQDCE